VQVEVLPYLRDSRRLTEIVHYTGCTRPDRLRAWLGIGTELGELDVIGERYRVRGRRSRALAGGDQLLVAHYRSMLEYQVGPYGSLEEFLKGDSGMGRSDLSRFAGDIAQVSRAAEPFVASFVRQAVATVRPANVLDVGCGSAVYSRVVLDTDAQARVEGIDLAADVIAAARLELDQAGYGSRVTLHVGDAQRWSGASPTQFDLIMLVNNIYYFDPVTRCALYRDLGSHLTEGGQLLIVSMLFPGSIASAHLHFMLTCQSVTTSLPAPGEIENDLRQSGFQILAKQTLVPTEPFIGVRARKIQE
jgi:SAM-dependent methyltransferase